VPTFSFRSMTLIKRITLFIHDGVIEHVIYPVFPPDQSAAEAVRWLREHVTSN
jgi:peroxiredoxin